MHAIRFLSTSFRTLGLLILSGALAGCSIASESSYRFDSIESQGVTPVFNSDITCLPGRSALMALGGQVVMQESARSDGWIFLGPNTHLDLKGRVTVNGGIIAMPNALVTGEATTTRVGGTYLSGGDPRISLVALTHELSLLEPKIHFGQLNEGRRIERESDVTAIDIQGDLELTLKDQLILSGSSTDRFVLKVSGHLKLSGEAGISLAGGLLSKNVVIQMVEPNTEVVLRDKSAIAGQLITEYSDVKLLGSSSVIGSIITNRDVGLSGSAMIVNPVETCIDLTHQ